MTNSGEPEQKNDSFITKARKHEKGTNFVFKELAQQNI
jgi:hypothetical protein